MGGALQGLKVIEMAAIGPVPFCGMMLADMGADVVRIDRPDVPLMAADNLVNRGRRSIALDLKQKADVELATKLIDKADILLEGFRPGVMERFGLGPDTLLARNPGLVFGRMTGWGQHGPLAHAAGHDINYIALSGALHAMSQNGQPPVPPLNLLGDYGGGAMMLLSGVLAACIEKQRSGQGQVVDVAMTDGVAALMALPYGLKATGEWHETPGTNMLDGGAHFYGCYSCADGGFISIGPLEPAFYAEFLQRCGIDDPAFRKQYDQRQWPELKQRLRALFATQPRQHWCDLLEGSDVCFAPVLSMAEAPLHPHNQARQTFSEAFGVVQPAPAPRFSRTPSSIGAAPPAIGAHSEAVLRDWLSG